MPQSLAELITRLDHIAAYDGPWVQLRDALPRLRDQIGELRDREDALEDVLVIALVGGSGVGKSTLLNALAGDTLARASEFRPCTTQPMVYAPPGAGAAFEGWERVTGSALEHLVIIDTPDSDTIVREHRARVVDVLRQCDLIFVCGSREKYLDEATWSLLRPLQGERALVCIETKAQGDNVIRDHWQQRIREQGFEVTDYFQVAAIKSLDRKLAGQAPGPEELDFPKLEEFLRKELSVERIRRIKRSNATGLLTKTVQSLTSRIAETMPRLDALDKTLEDAEGRIAKEALAVVERRLFTEPHLWAFALGRELSLRAKGIVGTCYRLIEAARSLPARISGWSPWRAVGGGGKQAAALLTEKDLFQDDLNIASDEIGHLYDAHHSEIALAFAKAGFDPPEHSGGADALRDAVNARVAELLRGPARDAVQRQARRLSNWGVALLADALPTAFIAYAGYNIVIRYFREEALQDNFLWHTAAVLVLLVGLELFVFSLLARSAAWSARRSALRALRVALAGTAVAFQEEKKAISEVRDLAQQIQEIEAAIQ